METSKPLSHGDQPEGDSEASGLMDRFSRKISYLRVSLTDQCNLRCLYCSPREIEKLPRLELLSYEELLKVIRLAADLGIRKLRLTGGEPLARSGVLGFIERLAEIPGLEEIRITTNGVLLAPAAERLFAAGIRKLNISLDSLRPARFAEITGVDAFDRVMAGIDKALALGFHPVKINVVAMRTVNDDEILEFARLALERPLEVRFIEFMPLEGGAAWRQEMYMPVDEIMERVRLLGDLVPVDRGRLAGPAKVYRLGEGLGKIGFISPISHHFCGSCNRLRLTSEGKLRSCLLSDQELDIKTPLRRGADDVQLQNLLREAIRMKPKGHELGRLRGNACHGNMRRIGG